MTVRGLHCKIGRFIEREASIFHLLIYKFQNHIELALRRVSMTQVMKLIKIKWFWVTYWGLHLMEITISRILSMSTIWCNYTFPWSCWFLILHDRIAFKQQRTWKLKNINKSGHLRFTQSNWGFFLYVSLNISRVDIGVQKLLEIDNKMYTYGPNVEKSCEYAISCDLLRLTFGGNI